MLLDLLKARGACRNADATLFFPDYDSPSANAAAIRICNFCTLKDECLEWALDHGEVGVWGGTGEADRRALLRKRHRVTCVVCGSENVAELNEGTHELCLECGTSWEV